ncbi:MAG TPA: FHA domain-containing protein [Nocardioidaceae bacterium]|nr:FHA domain-containing protein [Nocardioidaceae bacterium]
MKTGDKGFDDLTLRVLAGGGVVHRSPGTVLVIPTLKPSQTDVAEMLLGYCSNSADPTGRRLFRRVAAVLADSDPDTVPPLCLLVESEGGVAVMAHGSVSVVATGQREQRLSGAASLAWVEDHIDVPLSQVVVVADGDPPDLGVPALPFHLQSGTVPGGGIVLSSDGPGPAPLETVAVDVPSERSAPPADQPADTEGLRTPLSHGPHTFQSVLLTDPVQTEERLPLPLTPEQVTDEAGGEEPDAPAPSLVEGALCSRGHFNEPDAPYCSVCGISMLQRTRDTVLRPRPSLGVLVLDDGSAYTITSPYVLGREPETDDSVAAGKARPLTLDDESHSVSRVHALLSLDGWNVFITDHGSSNGTYLSSNGENGPWTALEPHAPTRLAARTHVRVGRRQLVFDSYHAKAPGP